MDRGRWDCKGMDFNKTVLLYSAIAIFSNYDFFENHLKQEKTEDNHGTRKFLIQEPSRNSSPSLSNLSGTAPVVQNVPVNSLKRKFHDDESVVFLDDMILQPLKDRSD